MSQQLTYAQLPIGVAFCFLYPEHGCGVLWKLYGRARYELARGGKDVRVTPDTEVFCWPIAPGDDLPARWAQPWSNVVGPETFVHRFMQFRVGEGDGTWLWEIRGHGGGFCPSRNEAVDVCRRMIDGIWEGVSNAEAQVTP